MWDDFAKWISAPSAYNWITLLGAISALMAAIFTGYSAYISWKSQKKFIRSEWRIEYRENFIIAICEVFNRTDQTIDLERAIAKGPVANILTIDSGRTLAKNESWDALHTPTPHNCHCKPYKTQTVSFAVHPSPQKLRKSTKSIPQKFQLSLGKLLWRSFTWRLGAGPKFSISLIARRRSSQLRPIRLTHSMRMYPLHAIKMADTIENKADKT
ncbi:MAG: hypothetical protein KJ731_21100 [Alphaproteobacteria bacterium]|nr:hypothetical protein [Alphaproteobacteria bacterium]MBU1280284.1 hypothetical protein [Alphaproteobacteria bacterium]MBU1573023.1 hypothetical protein [Alphaproteobacteria bacterium]MBU1830949.1 hypothetical protein [Alphaproteobacteria bacterium]MBU2079982.1 hypothetical protein [Alphaproteobacteria bacterium]